MKKRDRQQNRQTESRDDSMDWRQVYPRHSSRTRGRAELGRAWENYDGPNSTPTNLISPDGFAREQIVEINRQRLLEHFEDDVVRKGLGQFLDESPHVQKRFEEWLHQSGLAKYTAPKARR
jgi:hypothetical protein